MPSRARGVPGPLGIIKNGVRAASAPRPKNYCSAPLSHCGRPTRYLMLFGSRPRPSSPSEFAFGVTQAVTAIRFPARWPGQVCTSNRRSSIARYPVAARFTLSRTSVPCSTAALADEGERRPIRRVRPVVSRPPPFNQVQRRPAQRLCPRDVPSAGIVLHCLHRDGRRAL